MFSGRVCRSFPPNSSSLFFIWIRMFLGGDNLKPLILYRPNCKNQKLQGPLTGANHGLWVVIHGWTPPALPRKIWKKMLRQDTTESKDRRLDHRLWYWSINGGLKIPCLKPNSDWPEWTFDPFMVCRSSLLGSPKTFKSWWFGHFIMCWTPKLHFFDQF